VTFCNPCIRVSLSKSSCEETPEESLRVNRQSLCIHLLTDQSSRARADRQTRPDQSRTLRCHSCQNKNITVDADASYMHTRLGVVQLNHADASVTDVFLFRRACDCCATRSGYCHVLTACISTMRWNLYSRSHPCPRICKLMSAVSPERKALYRWDCIS
jgi:hypothetical protein